MMTTRKRKGVYIYKIARNYTSCVIWWGSWTFRNKLGSSTIVLDKGLSRRERYQIIVEWIVKQTGGVAPSYRPTVKEKHAKIQ